MKFVEVVVLADATVKETWTLKLPNSAIVNEKNALDFIGGHSDLPRYGTGRYVHSMTDEVVGDEDNRQVESIRELSGEPASPPALHTLAGASVTAQSLRSLEAWANSRGPGETLAEFIGWVTEAVHYNQTLTLRVGEDQ